MIIPFEKEFRKELYKLYDEIFDSSFWSEGKQIKHFEEKFSKYCNLESRAVSSGGAGLISILDYIDVKGKDVIVPANTFWASAQSVIKAGGNVIYADCNKEDLSLSFEDMVSKITPNTKAVIVVHIGGHIAFDIEKIASFCKSKKIFLVEDCAHAHGAVYKGKMAGSWGLAGSYSFYATKTMPTGDGGVVVSTNKDFLDWVVKYRNYGKEVINGKVTYPIKTGFNYRMPEFIAALGIVQLSRIPMILDWKNELAQKYDQIFSKRVHLPEGMISGYYKYIVFEQNLSEKTGQVFGPDDLGYRIEGKNIELVNSEWVVRNHQCAPIYYGWDKAKFTVEKLREHLIGK